MTIREPTKDEAEMISKAYRILLNAKRVIQDAATEQKSTKANKEFMHRSRRVTGK